MPTGQIKVSNDELATVREAMRTLNRMVDDLETGTREKVVLTRHGRMVAVLTSIEAHEQPRRRKVSRASTECPTHRWMGRVAGSNGPCPFCDQVPA